MIDKLKKVIQEANSDIMKLKFGCEYKSIEFGYKAVYLGDSFVWLLEDERMTADYDIIKRKRDFKILGRPITLADVLIAMDNKYSGVRYYVTLRGGFIKVGTSWIQTTWNLQKNNLDDQSEETKKFLTDLLV